MYLEWMKKHLLIITILQFSLVIFVLVFKQEFHYGIYLTSFLGGLFWGALQYIICKLVYRNSKSLKINLMLVMWDIFFYFSVILSLRNSNAIIQIMVILFLVRTELTIFSRKFNIKGK